MDNEIMLKLYAEAPVTELTEQDSNDVYMIATIRMLSTAPNSNKHVIKADFINEIVENQEWYVGTPVKADTDRLAAGHKTGLGHLFNRRRGVYMTHQIGSILSFEAKEEDGEDAEGF